MKKKKLLASLLVAGAVLGLAACTSEDKPNDDSKDDSSDVEKQTYTVTFNSNGGSAVTEIKVEEGKTITKPANPTQEGKEFKGWYTDAACTKEFVFTTAINANTTLYAKWEDLAPEIKVTVTYVLNGHGDAIDALTDVNQLPATLPTPTAAGFTFLGWYTDEALKTPAVAGAALTENVTLYADWIKEGYERADYLLTVDDLEIGSYNEGLTVNRFELAPSTPVRDRKKTYKNPDDPTDTKSFNKSIQLKDSTAALIVNSPGTGKLTFYVQNGSSGADTQYLILTKPDETKQEIEYVGNSGGSPVVRIDLDVVEGEYKIQRKSSTSDIFYAELHCEVPIAEESGFEIVSTGNVDYIEGQEFDSSKLQLNKVFGNGRTDTLLTSDENVTIDASKFDATTPGAYEITVKYKEYTPLTYTVNVYAFKDIELDFVMTEKLSTNSAAGNGVYFNHAVKRVYALNEDFDASHLVVTAITGTTNNDKEEDFILGSANYTIDSSKFNNTAAGSYTITVSVTFNNVVKKADFIVHVVDTAPSIVEEKIQVKVDQSYTGTIGAVNSGYNMFTSVQQALDYLGGLSTEYTNTQKVLVLSAGNYFEKLEITIPNLEIRGDGKATTKIEWDSLFGIPDASGYIQTTDSTATVSIRDAAVNCTISGVTISNYWNSVAVFDEAFGPGYGEHRALALLVQSDMFILKDSSLLGYQDTVEFFTGRQFIEDCYISGTTDFIFGTNNTTYFKNSEIHSISNGKTDGGYITAFKGNNKGDSDAVVYGAIFDGCHFTADADVVTNGNTAIGRPWGKYAAVMVMNSTLDGHISKTPYSNSSKNQRYVSMSGVNPTDSTVKYLEYNNTGDGAITESIAGCTVLTDATEAAKYANYSIIFGTTNGGVGYNNTWDPTSNIPVVDNNIYYVFNSASNPTGTNYVYDQQLQGATSTLGDLTLDATVGKINARPSDTQINTGSKLILTVKAGSTLTVNTYPGYHAYKLNGVETNKDVFTQYYAVDTEVTLEAIDTMYLYSLVVRPNQEAPAEKTLESIQLSKQQTKFELNAEFSYSNLVVKGVYSDGSIVTLEDTAYEVSHKIDNTTAGTYAVTVTVGDKTATYDVVYGEIDRVIRESVTYSFRDDTSNAADNYIVYEDQAIDPSLDLGNITITSVNSSAGNNDAWLKFNTGSTITFEVAGPCSIEITYYNPTSNTEIKLGDTVITDGNITTAGVVTITATGNGYLGKIIITFPATA